MRPSVDVPARSLLCRIATSVGPGCGVQDAQETLGPRLRGDDAKPQPIPERPRERLAAQGPEALTDAELIAVVLGSGVRGASALDVARAALARHGGVSGLIAAGARKRIRGFGIARYAQLAAGVELARRAARESLARGETLTSPDVVRDYLRLTFASLEHEVFAGLFRGTLAQTSVYPREVVKCALALNAAAVIFAHNHPSGIAEPSRADELLTQSLKSALALVDVRTLDHFVVAGGQVVSFAERGLL